jgi:hypothetical protein
MWLWKKKKNLAHAALVATPCDIDLSGHWLAWDVTNAANRVLFGVSVQQYGTAVFARMQCKFALAAPLTIRGIVCDRRLIANFWRPDDYLMGSGMLDLVVEPKSESIEGTSEWYDAETGECHVQNWQWECGPAD